MPESPFDHLSTEHSSFPIAQCDDILQSVMNELANFRLLCCITGFPKSGKSFFAQRLKQNLQVTNFLVQANGQDSISRIIHTHLGRVSKDCSTLSAQLKQNKRVILLIDNAHLLSDDDYAVLTTFFTLAEQVRSLLQVILIGNGEMAQRISKQENRAIFNMLGNIWNIPKLTREQSQAFVRFLLDSAGLAKDLIPNPEPLVKKAAGNIGLLRTLTVTLALKALSGQDIQHVDSFLSNQSATTLAETPEHSPDREMPVQNMVNTASPWISRILVALALIAIMIFIVLYFIVRPNHSLNTMMTSGFKDVVQATQAGRNDNSPGTGKLAPAPQEQQLLPNMNASSIENKKDAQNETKTTFRKRTQDGPYSILLATYASIDGLMQHVSRLNSIDIPLLWDKTDGENPQYELYMGRFDDFGQAGKFAVSHQLNKQPIVFRPFVVCVGPIGDAEKLRTMSAIVGLPEPQNHFIFEFDSGKELQFALERTKEDAMDQCREIEAKGLSCSVTLFE